MKYFCYIGCGVLTKEVCQEVTRTRAMVDLRFIPAGFHEQPAVLHQILQDEIDRIEAGVESKRKSPENPQEYEAILLGLGLCDNAIVGLQSRKIPLVVPRAHDCITILLGSAQRYHDIFQENSGNFWYSCGWIERMLPPGADREQQLCRNYRAKYGAENAAFLMTAEAEWQKNYQSATFIHWDLPDNLKHREYTRECASHLGWDFRELVGDPGLLRDLLSGNWDAGRFLQVNPGEQIRASFDERVITSQRIEN